MMQTLRAIKQIQKRPDGIFGSFMTRPVSHVFAFVALKLRMTPNIVSFLSFVFCALGVAALIPGPEEYPYLIAAIALWWFGAILDAADGDLARYAKMGTPFGGWFDSFLDRIKEFMIFAAFGYFTFKIHGDELYLLLGIVSIFTNVMSGYVSDTKKLFISGRTPEIQISKKYSFGMVDTRDFVVILSLALNEMRIALVTYSTLFLLALCGQIVIFIRKYARPGNRE